MGIRITGVCADVDDKEVIKKVEKIRERFGSDYQIIIDRGHICIRGSIPHDIRKMMDKILEEE